MKAEDTLMWKEIAESPEAVTACSKKNYSAVTELARKFKKRTIKNIMIAGRGTSDHAAVYGQYIFGLLSGIPVTFSAPSLLTLYKCNFDLKDWLVIGISQSGQTADAVTVVAAARRQGALTAGITNEQESPLAEAAEYVLFCSAGPEKSVAATKTFITEMDLLLQMALAVSGNTQVTEEHRSLPDSLRSVLGMAGEIKALVPRYRFMSDCFVLARGSNYSVALEAALKIQETTYVKALGFAISDFYHGPLAMVNDHLPVIIIAPGIYSVPEAAAFIDRIRESRADTLVISDNRDLCRKGTVSLHIPVTGSDCINPFHCAVIIQMFACQLAALLDNNPDKPRMLEKVAVV
ncbi:MAG: SIS domain-containing protein [Treponema sp.]|jgi:glucosamine--fructose-6-phosphate aminotransferase (isomerizing)|nr:SIS domain-containing protein [Treponema sp.]